MEQGQIKGKYHVLINPLPRFTQYLVSWPVVDHGHHLSFILATEIHSTWTSKQPRVVLTHQSNCGSVYYRCKVFDVINKNLDEKSIGLLYQIKMLEWAITSQYAPPPNLPGSTVSHSCHVVYLRSSILLRIQHYLVGPEYFSPMTDMTPLTFK